MDPDVIEIPPPIHHPSKLRKQKQAVSHEVIEIDNDDDYADLVIIGEKVSKRNKGKTIEAVHDGYGDHQVVEMSGYTFCQPDVGKSGPPSKMDSSNGYPSVSHNLVNGDGHFGDISYDDDDYDLFSEDYMDVDEYALLQAHFDNVDIPPGIEAPIPWLLEPTNPKIQGPSVGGSNLQLKMDNVDHPSSTELSSPQLYSQAASSKKKSATSQRRGRDLKKSSGVESSKSRGFLGPFQSKKKLAISHGFIDNSGAMKMPSAGEPPHWGKFKSAKNATGSSSSYHSNFVGHNGSFPPQGVESTNPGWNNSHSFKPLFTNYTANPTYYPFDPLHAPPAHVFDNAWVHNSANNGNNGRAMDSPVATISDQQRDEILRKFQSFKQFDTVEDTSDHYFVRNNSSMKQHPKNWAKKIQEEWKILEKDLPNSIFVRVYESRMDLLRAVIIGAEGTPYHDGLFFFDIFFPSGYPNVPPQVHYHSGGLRLNPNLYHCGKVCLSLLNTWSGNKNEKWLPGVSTILQVLVSIQGLILNTKPYFNEPGFERTSGSANGEKKSLKYNEDTFILSLKTMMYMMRRPPKNFEDFVLGHFCSRASDVLVACKAYMEGAQVGCLVKGGVQDVDEGDRSCSKQFKESLTGYMNMLVKEFAQIGAKDCEKFLPPATTVNKSFSGLAGVAT